MTGRSPALDVARLYSTGSSWLHRAHPLTKLALVPAVTALAIAPGGYAAPALALVALTLAAILSGVGRLAATSLVALAPIAVALLAIHVPFHPHNQTAIGELGSLVLYREGLDYALTVLARLGVFVAAVAMALRSTHPKALATALVASGVSHKVCYSYLAGAELVPDLQRRAREILDAQQARGFETAGSWPRRLRTLLALLKPLLVGALIAVETRSLALESRGFSVPGPRTSTVPLTRSRVDAVAQWGALVVTALASAWAVAG